MGVIAFGELPFRFGQLRRQPVPLGLHLLQSIALRGIEMATLLSQATLQLGNLRTRLGQSATGVGKLAQDVAHLR